MFGEENVVVMVKAELDFSETREEDVLYSPIRPAAARRAEAAKNPPRGWRRLRYEVGLSYE